MSDFPFKGDEAALRNMEHAELISITTKDGKDVSTQCMINVTDSAYQVAHRL